MQTGGSATSYGGIAGMPAQLAATKENTLLESHLHELSKLNETLTAAVHKASAMADRLIGPEPPGPTGAGNGSNAAQPPLITRVEGAVSMACQLAESVHRQLNRLDRL